MACRARNVTRPDIPLSTIDTADRNTPSPERSLLRICQQKRKKRKNNKVTSPACPPAKLIGVLKNKTKQNNELYFNTKQPRQILLTKRIIFNNHTSPRNVPNISNKALAVSGFPRLSVVSTVTSFHSQLSELIHKPNEWMTYQCAHEKQVDEPPFCHDLAQSHDKDEETYGCESKTK